MCHDGQDCENTIGSYRCVMRCGRGFRRTADGLSCLGAQLSLVLYIYLCILFICVLLYGIVHLILILSIHLSSC